MDPAAHYVAKCRVVGKSLTRCNAVGAACNTLTSFIMVLSASVRADSKVCSKECRDATPLPATDLKWNRFEAGFRNDSDRVSPPSFAVIVKAASALPFQIYATVPNGYRNPAMEPVVKGSRMPSENVPSEPCRYLVRTVPAFDHGVLPTPFPTGPLVTALEATQSPAGRLPKRRRYAVMAYGWASFQIPFPTPCQSEYCRRRYFPICQ